MEKNKSSSGKYRAYFQYQTLIPINEERKQLKKITDQSGTLKKNYFKVVEEEVSNSQIRNIFLLGTLPEDLQRKTYDVSLEGDGSVQLWLERDGAYGDLYIGGKGGVEAPEDSSELFECYENVKKIIFEEGFNTKSVIDMSSMFWRCERLKELDLSSFDTKSVTDMSGMFAYCERLQKLNINNFDTRNVKNMEKMFEECNLLQKIDVKNFNTARVENMWLMFGGCRRLKETYVGYFNTGKVRDMSGMFARCEQLRRLNVSNFDTSKVERMSYMFIGARCCKDWM